MLFDKNDPRHASIPQDITRAEDLPHGALVISVDTSPLSEAEVSFLKKRSAETGDAIDIPPQGHAIYITGREGQVEPLRKALTRKIDKRAHPDEPYGPHNVNYGVTVLVDKPNEHEHYDDYHMTIAGNNHPQSPVEGLRRIATNGEFYKVVERLSVEGPMSHEHANRALLDQRPMLLSPHAAKELFDEMTEAVRSRSGRHEKGLFERLKWPEGRANEIQGKLDRLAAQDELIQARAEEERVRRGQRSGRVIDEKSGSGPRGSSL